MAATGIDAKIVEGLLERLSQLVTTPVTRVAKPNVTFKPGLGEPYLQASVLPNTTTSTGLSFASSKDRQGLMQVSVFWPSNQGQIKATDVASQVATHFERGTRIHNNGVCVRIDEAPSIKPPLQESDWHQTPVVIRWRVISST